MLILNQKETVFIDSNYYSGYAVIPHGSGFRVCAFTSNDRENALKLGWYEMQEEAKEALLQLHDALNRGEDSFILPEMFERCGTPGYVYPE